MWKDLHETHKDTFPGLSKRAQLRLAQDLVRQIEVMFEGIVKRARRYSSYGTKLNAVETMLKILDGICLN